MVRRRDEVSWQKYGVAALCPRCGRLMRANGLKTLVSESANGERTSRSVQYRKCSSPSCGYTKRFDC